ncbi:uncharacterized protein L969DRAFT_78166 [Mixia osmundae IAM 14324]|uniref:C2H2-type domain-containing protein n=1 Tax=Mixia osmundae (strain CBS 9802 / IAM 14324 / JCM 22182 / KY 12970) TaxID=764103 RepID=G7E519_MIXOS|nr:uncharacterized protein L969DRAFT_78166 [Mixia osmundae IAM 14324]KEI37790.1 hypothetical protein L969DRAFT_78166 [Mixia osmundae IAM 14324]GAA97929.1 hypothetical protein E5Q_04609 [Mixia osmundae IAM 14324]
MLRHYASFQDSDGSDVCARPAQSLPPTFDRRASLPGSFGSMACQHNLGATSYAGTTADPTIPMASHAVGAFGPTSLQLKWNNYPGPDPTSSLPVRNHFRSRTQPNSIQLGHTVSASPTPARQSLHGRSTSLSDLTAIGRSGANSPYSGSSSPYHGHNSGSPYQHPQDKMTSSIYQQSRFTQSRTSWPMYPILSPPLENDGMLSPPADSHMHPGATPSYFDLPPTAPSSEIAAGVSDLALPPITQPASTYFSYDSKQPDVEVAPEPQQDRPFKCDECAQSFNRNHDLKRHKRIHLAVKPFPCAYCDKSFSRRDALKRHLLVRSCNKALRQAQPEASGSSPNKSESDSVSPPQMASTSPATTLSPSFAGTSPQLLTREALTGDLSLDEIPPSATDSSMSESVTGRPYILPHQLSNRSISASSSHDSYGETPGMTSTPSLISLQSHGSVGSLQSLYDPAMAGTAAYARPRQSSANAKRFAPYSPALGMSALSLSQADPSLPTHDLYAPDSYTDTSTFTASLADLDINADPLLHYTHNLNLEPSFDDFATFDVLE